MTKITLNHVGSLQDITTAQTVINADLDIIQTAFDNTLSRDGTTPNQMASNIDVNSNRILNLPKPLTADEPLRLQELSDFVGGGTVTNIPSGGTTGQTLSKTTNTNYDVSWQNSAKSVGLSLPSDFTVTGSPVTGTGTLTGSWAVTPTGTGAVVRATSPTLTTPVVAAGTTIVGGALGFSVGTLNYGDSTANHVVVSTDQTQTLTNKTLTSPVMTTPTLGAASGTSLNLSGLTASSAVATDGSKNLVSVTNTGTGSNVLATSPTLVTPVLGAATGTSLNLSGLTASNAVATDGSKNLVSVANTGTGSNVLATTPTLVTPVLGAATGTSLNLSGLTASSAVATDGSKNLVSVTNTGSGNNVLATSPTLVTPALGAATATTINGATIDNNAWTAYTPTIGSQAGTITTSSATGRFKQLGKTVFVEMNITITTAGTGSGYITASLPGGLTATAFPFSGSSREFAVSGKSGSAYIAASGTTALIIDSAGTTYIANGAALAVSITYESI